MPQKGDFMSHNCGQKHATIITDNFRNINDNSMNQSMDARLHRLPRGVFRRFDLSAVWKKQGKQAFFKSQDCNYLQKLQSYSVQVCNMATQIAQLKTIFRYIVSVRREVVRTMIAKFSVRLKELRLSMNLRQEQVAKLIGVNKSAIYIDYRNIYKSNVQ